MISIDNALNNLSHSKFRTSFHLKEKDLNYIKEKGLDTIKIHTSDFIKKRLAPRIIINDGHQTPYRGHPTFIARHATATCCRNCLYKWYKIPKDKELTQEEQEYIVNLIMAWINKQISK